MGNLSIVVDTRRGGIAGARQGFPQITGSPILLGGNASANVVPRDPVVDAKIQELSAPVVAYNTLVVGSTSVLLSNAAARIAESNMADLICEAMLDHIRTQSDFEAKEGTIDVCIINGGGVRTSIPIVSACDCYCVCGQAAGQSCSRDKERGVA